MRYRSFIGHYKTKFWVVWLWKFPLTLAGLFYFPNSSGNPSNGLLTHHCLVSRSTSTLNLGMCTSSRVQAQGYIPPVFKFNTGYHECNPKLYFHEAQRTGLLFQEGVTDL